MTGAAAGPRVDRDGLTAGMARWASCMAVVVGLHIGAVLLLTRLAAPVEPPRPAPEALLLELPPAPEPAAEPAPPMPATATQVPVEPPQQPPPSEPPQTPEAPPPPPALPAMVPQPLPPQPVPPPSPASVPERPASAPPRPPPPRPRPPPPRPRATPAPERAASSMALPSLAPAPASPAPAPPSPLKPPALSEQVAAAPSSAVPNWRNELIGKLQRAKRYPDVARSRGDQGTAVVTFTMDRAGRVLAASLTRTSGSALLDEEAVSLVRRAAPLPVIPPEMPSETVTLTVPVTFTLR